MPVVSIPDQDVAILAMMCNYCRADVRKHGLIDRHYGYYVPLYDEDLDIAKSIFARNGVYMEKHLSNILGRSAQTVLRVNYDFLLNKNNVRQEVEKVERKFKALYLSRDNEEKVQLNGHILHLRQNQK